MSIAAAVGYKCLGLNRAEDVAVMVVELQTCIESQTGVWQRSDSAGRNECRHGICHKLGNLEDRSWRK